MNQNRNKKIVMTSLVGIAANLMLSVFKVIIGTMTRSIAITLDAVNNVSDAASSVITIVGAKLAGKDADKKHPFGHGRIEYFSALIISIIVFYAGFSSLKESVKSIIHPDQPAYGPVALIIVAVAVVVKILLGRYFVSVGKKVDSASLVNSGKDAALDSIISLSTLVAAGIYLLTDLSLEAYLGVAISAVIIKSAYEMLMETVSKLLGEHTDFYQAKAIKATIAEFPEVIGAYDLVLNDYGPDSFQGSVHVEVLDTCTASDFDKLTRAIVQKVFEKHKVKLMAVGMYSVNTQDQQAIDIREKIRKIAMSFKYVTQIHGFYLDEAQKDIRFDLVISFEAKSRRAVYEEVVNAIKDKYPDYTFNVSMDTDFIARIDNNKD